MMPENRNSVVLPNRKRASRPKVRTGCVTCKSRHVRCDERKPTCERCEKANVPCAGYTAPAPAQAIRPALVPACFSDGDIVYFNFFRHSLVEDLSGYLHDDFWSRVVLSENTRDECVQHGILAIGALSRAIFPGTNVGPSPRGPAATGASAAPLHPCSGGDVLTEHHGAAIHHQNQAINLCLKRIRDGPDCMSPRALLINTLLLLAYELLQGNMTGADGLMTMGIRLLRDSVPILRETVLSTSGPSPPPQPPRRLMVPDAHDRELADMEHMLPYLSIMSGHTFGACAPQLRLYSHLISSAVGVGRFHTHALIFGLQARAMHAGPAAAAPGSDSSTGSAHPSPLHDPVQVEMERVRFLAGLGHWREVILEARERATAGSDGRTRRALRLVHIQYLATLIDASSCRDVSDMAYDAFEPEFRELLRLCGECVAEAEREPVSKIGFTFEGGSIAAPVTLIASKCRRCEVRLKAISLSKRLSWREGAWDAKTLLCALGVVVLEEEARKARGFVEAKDRVRWCGVTWDRERRLVIGDYIHVLYGPDGEGGMRTRRVALDVDRWEPETVDEGVRMPVALSPGAGGSAGGRRRSVVGSIMSVATR
ncbi:hypothetical protein B0T18DRAFT_448733 [Schizothecium vesticola]|uniref:Zn(2)-C6 fungal-type domain-containing protein n=1 Tax=Schizothecium vesticola TaxID=314040 RepID=A0AA40ERM5_9PEZI|nr:hypothetical protein B0T18DRAFT_448733 [Schizothecium vesticola]